MSKRFNTIEILVIAILISPALIFVCRAEEQITLTTYYPAPNGIYKNLSAERMMTNAMSVGSTYRTATVGDGYVVISGRTGIGTNTPSGKLDVVMANGASRVSVKDDTTNVGIDVRSVGVGGLAYLDFSQDAIVDYNMRLSLLDATSLSAMGGNIKVPQGNIYANGLVYVGMSATPPGTPGGCLMMSYGSSSGKTTCPPGFTIETTLSGGASPDGGFLFCCS